MKRSWREVPTREIDAAVERDAERQLDRYETEQDRLQAEDDEREDDGAWEWEAA